MCKKILYYLLCIFLVTSCAKKESFENNINTLIEEDKNILVGINYPVTGFKILDTVIHTDIETIYDEFKDEYETFNSIPEN